MEERQWYLKALKSCFTKLAVLRMYRLYDGDANIKEQNNVKPHLEHQLSQNAS